MPTTHFNVSIILVLLCIFFFSGYENTAQSRSSLFNVIAFYTLRDDKAHITFVHEANKWFAKAATKHKFRYDSTSTFNNLNPEFLSRYQVVLFLDSRPESPEQREAFQKFMENGGGWLGFHFAGFALNNSRVPQTWDWYHNSFLSSGEYTSNTWRPTSAILRIEGEHPVTKHLPKTFTAAPNEWYRWDTDLKATETYKFCYP